MKLTNTQRDNIVRIEAEKRFDKEVLKEREELGKITSKAFIKEQCKTKIPQELIDLGYIRVTMTVNVSFGKEGHRTVSVSLPESIPVKVHSSTKMKPTKEMIEQYAKLSAIKEAKSKFISELRSILYSLYSDKQVSEHLPELNNYFKENVKMSTALIPIERINNMRAMLH